MRANKKLSQIMLGKKGGANRLRILRSLIDRPYNANQMAELLDLNYRTIKHHLDVLAKNDLVRVSADGGYGEVYFLTPEMEAQIGLLDELEEMMANGKKLKTVSRSRRYYQNIVEQSADAIVLMDKNMRVYTWNKGAERLYGYTFGEVLNSKMPAYTGREEDDYHELLKELAKAKKSLKRESLRERRDGTEVPVELTLTPIVDSDGTLIGMSEIARDVTERKKLEDERMLRLQAAEEERRRLDDIVSSMGAGLSLISPDYEVEWMNRTHREMFGPLEQVKGHHCYETFWGRSDNCEGCVCDKVFDSGKALQEVQERTGRDGKRHEYLITATPVHDEDGGVTSVLELVQQLDIEKICTEG